MIRQKAQPIGSATDAASGVDYDHRFMNGARMSKRRINQLRALVGTGLRAVAFVSLVRRIGPRRIGRVAAFAAQAYLDNARRGLRRRDT